MKSTPSEPRSADAFVHTDELDRRTRQLWIGIWLATIFVLLSTFVVRRLTGNSTTPLAITMQVILNGLVIANLWLINTSYARLAQGIYVFAIHLAVPPVLIFYGGTGGFGDIALYMAILIALLYGWQRWMFFTYGLMAATLIWVIYRDSIGDPVEPLLDYSTQFTAFKFIVTACILMFALRYISTFYKRLVAMYRTFAEAQVRLNAELTASEQTLEQVNERLIASRQAIVTVREEERRRLRRDLHDGLGPALAAQVFRVGVAQQLITQNPQKAAALLVDVEADIRDTLANVRELVYDLRPPLLDQLGLLGALSHVVKQQAGRLTVRLELPTELANLSAAVEVAVFRIVQAALDNVVKHAQATYCAIHLRVDEQCLTLTLTDDGVGIPERQLPGVGLTAMRERAEELGGRFAVRSIQPHGTLIDVRLPLHAIAGLNHL